MDLIGSIIRRLKIKIVGSSGSQHQTMRDSDGAMQIGRDVNFFQGTPEKSSPEKSSPKIGEASFPDFQLSLDVHKFSLRGDRADPRYRASLATRQIASFEASLREADYGAFQIRDNQDEVSMECTVTVSEGPYKGIVRFITITERQSDSMVLRCWFELS